MGECECRIFHSIDTLALAAVVEITDVARTLEPENPIEPNNLGLRAELLARLVSTVVAGVFDPLHETEKERLENLYEEAMTRYTEHPEDTHPFAVQEEDGMAPPTLSEIEAAEHERCDRIWYDRHMSLHADDHTSCPSQDNAGCGPAEQIRQTYGVICGLDERVDTDETWGPVGPYDDFDWGRLTGQLETLRWILGSGWGDLDT